MARLGVTASLLLASAACWPWNTGPDPSCPRELSVSVDYDQPLPIVDGGYHYDFGNVGLDGGTSVDLRLTEDCGLVRIKSVALDGGPGFIFPAFSGGGLAFDPTEFGSYQAVLTLWTDSQVQPVVSIELTGASPAPGPPCAVDTDCSTETFCDGRFCRPACRGFSNLPDGGTPGRSCAPQSTACAGDAGWLLVDTLADVQNCGGCGKACPEGEGCGGGKCGSCSGYLLGTERDYPVEIASLGTNYSFAVTDVGVGDMDQDGFPDLLLAVEIESPGPSGLPQNQYNAILVISNDGKGGFGAASRTVNACGPSLALGDFDGDCRLDVSSAGAILVNDGHGEFALRNSRSTLVSADATQLTVMDLNGDGQADLAFGNQTPLVYLGDGKGSFTPSFDDSMQLPLFAVADFNQDGRPDVAGLARADPNTPIECLRNQYGFLVDEGSFADPGAGVFTPTPSSFAAGDLAGVGLPALVYGEDSNVVVIPDPFGGATGASLMGLDGGFNGLAVADLDLDGHPDVVGAEASTSSDGGLIDLWTGFAASDGGSLVPGSLQTVLTSVPAAFIKVADLNGDGIPDIVAVSSRFDYLTASQVRPIVMVFLGGCP